jgi:hypothetical protein
LPSSPIEALHRKPSLAFEFVRENPNLVAAVGLLSAALVLRAVALGQPEVDVDEQFYLLVGDRMLHGLVPYVDIWDRKPIGLFLIYAAARAIGGAGVMGYQVLALVSAAATAWIIRVTAIRLGSNQAGAWLGGLAYLLWINLLGGVGGQAPVFFNLPMAIAALVLVREISADARSPGSLVRAGLGSMTLVGIAIQIKYTALFEGIFFGCAYLWLAFRDRLPLWKVATFGAGMISLALLPTALATAFYWWIGHLHEFVFANFVSISGRLPLPRHEVFRRASTLALVLVPLMLLALLGLRFGVSASEVSQERGRRFVLAWLTVATLVVIVFGYFFDHYGLPIALPAALAAAPLLSNWRKTGVYVAGLFLIALIAGQALALDEISSSGGWRTIRAIDRAGRSVRNCPFVYDGPSVIYALRDWCTPTRYPFPYHLSYFPESRALGIDVMSELGRIMRNHPDLVLIRQEPYPNENLAARAMMLRELRRDYVIAGSTPFHHSKLVIFRLRPGIVAEPNEVVRDLAEPATWRTNPAKIAH